MVALTERIEAWHASLDDPALQPPLGLLSADEEARAAAFVRAQDRRYYRAAHALQRWVLATHLDQRPEALAFTTIANGKPVLVGIPNLHFNLSRGGSVGLVAVAGLPIGTDVETKRDVPELVAIARRYFAPAELEFLTKAFDQATTFLRLWVAKEAVLKALGVGLGHGLSNFAIALNEPGGPFVRAQNPMFATLTLRELDFPGATAAVAMRGPVREVRHRRFFPNARKTVVA